MEVNMMRCNDILPRFQDRVIVGSAAIGRQGDNYGLVMRNVTCAYISVPFSNLIG